MRYCLTISFIDIQKQYYSERISYCITVMMRHSQQEVKKENASRGFFLTEGGKKWWCSESEKRVDILHFIGV